MASSSLSVRRAIATVTLASVGSALLLACGAFVAYEVVSFRATMVRTLSAQADIIGRQSTSALVFNDPDAASSTLGALQADPHVVAASIFSGNGELFATYRRAGNAQAGPSRPPAGDSDGHVFSDGRLVLYRRIVFDQSPIGWVVIESDLDELTTRLERYGLIALAVFVASLAFAYGIASRLQRAVTEPILRLVDAAQVVSTRQDYSVRAPGEARGELGLLIQTFNHMLEQIEERDEALRGARDGLERQVDERTRDLQAEIARRETLAGELQAKNRELEEQSLRVQEATRLKSEFLANMSHELRTPLNAIVGFAELLHDERVGAISAHQKECLADILTSSRHLLQLINDVLDLSKVEAGKMEFHPERVDLSRVVGEVRDILRGLAAKKRITLAMEIDPGLGEIEVDPGKLKQVLYNYLSNALKFTPEGGRVFLRGLPEGADRFRVEVEDNGIGIRAEDLPRLFAEFQQLDASAAKTHPGTGLGLALTKRIVEAQGGEVRVHSSFGSGSVFSAVLPRATAAAATSIETEAKANRARPGAPAILVVEDDAKDRAWLVDTLQAAGYTVEVAVSGGAAVELCRTRAFDGITLDLFLADMTGWDVLREIRKEGRNQGTPVIVATVVAEEGIGTGFAVHDYLAKPIEEDRLLSSLARAGVLPAGHSRVLVVDDDPQARRLVETALAGLGYRPLGVGSAEEALHALETELPAAVVLDLLLPSMDGFDFLRRFRRRAAVKATPVIVWTAKDLTPGEHARLGALAQAIVLKRDGGTSHLMDELALHVSPGATREGEERQEGERAR